MDIAFSGAGFMGVYYFGVVDCWNKFVPRDRINRVAGTSAGSLSGAYYVMNLPLERCLKEIIELTESVRKRPLGVFDRSNQIVDLLPKLLDRIFPEDAHKQCSGKLYICMTRMKDMKKVLVNEFETRKDLIDALNCSCFIPVWSGNHVPTYKGVKHIDGGFSDGLPCFDEHTIRVCPFSGASDISPYDRAKMELLHVKLIGLPLNITLNNFRRVGKALFPPNITFMIELLERGYHDAKDFLLSYDLIQCDTCYNKTDLQSKPIFKQLSPTITPSVSPAISRTCSFRDLANMSPPIELIEPVEPIESIEPIELVVEQKNNFLTVQDKFIPHQSPLPSCPPSPNLNRHCSECLRMRQEARQDTLDEELKIEAEKWRSDSEREIALETGGFRNKLASPFRWIRQLGKKTSYKFDEQSNQQQLQLPAMAR